MVFLVPADKGIRDVAEAKQAGTSVIEHGSELTATSAEMVHDLPSVLRLAKAERAMSLHMKEEARRQSGVRVWTQRGDITTFAAALRQVY